MLLEILVEIVLIWLWAFHMEFSSIYTSKNLMTVPLSTVIPSINISENFVGMKRYLEVRWNIAHLVLSVLTKLQSNFTEMKLRHGCSPVNLLHILRTPFPKNGSGVLLLKSLVLFELFECFFEFLKRKFFILHRSIALK